MPKAVWTSMTPHINGRNRAHKELVEAFAAIIRNGEFIPEYHYRKLVDQMFEWLGSYNWIEDEELLKTIAPLILQRMAEDASL